MDLKQSVKAASLNKSTYINLRWIGILGQFITINTVKFIFGFEFNFILSNLIIFVGALSNFYLMFFYKKPMLILVRQTIDDLISNHGEPDECVKLPVHFWGFTDCQA